MTINYRIKEIRDKLCEGLTKNLASRLKVSSQAVSNYMREGYNVGREVIEKILTVFPDINAAWLLTGEGEMLRVVQKIGDISNSTVVGANVNGNGNKITYDEFAGMIELQKGYQELLRKKDEQIDRLLSLIDKKK
jgi:transcriptional regulator with XRE-family HTH domain